MWRRMTDDGGKKRGGEFEWGDVVKQGNHHRPNSDYKDVSNLEYMNK